MMISRPIVAGTIGGLLFGDAAAGFAAGAFLEVLSFRHPPYGAALRTYEFVDTLVDPGGLWSFSSGTMQSISNQWAAMPSLHIGWALWCTIALYPVLRRRWSKIAIVAYPAVTMFAIVITANHYWLDGVGGAVVLAAGYLVGSWLTNMRSRSSDLEAESPPVREQTSVQ